jgi:hypothetical protein
MAGLRGGDACGLGIKDAVTEALKEGSRVLHPLRGPGAAAATRRAALHHAPRPAARLSLVRFRLRDGRALMRGRVREHTLAAHAGVVTEVNKSDLRQKPYTVEFDNGEIHHYRSPVATRRVATQHNSPRCNAAYCNAARQRPLQRGLTRWRVAQRSRCSVLQRVALGCNALQHKATCHALQRACCGSRNARASRAAAGATRNSFGARDHFAAVALQPGAAATRGCKHVRSQPLRGAALADVRSGSATSRR